MFRVNRSENRIRRLDERRFAELGLRERDHLQEWVANLPDALGEDLLIIQKEFDGFADTRERLDLLALDKFGQLVVIENKLDDSGRDVMWQAVKYAAYCSSLTKTQIVDIYQNYLDRHRRAGESAVDRISEFLGTEDLEEVALNHGNGQRIIFIAAKFRKEVTAAVLWLLTHGIDAKCFRIVPYSFGEELFVDLQQIIPTPETADFMIGMASKGVDEQNTQVVLKPRHHLRRAFWEMALPALVGVGLTRYESISASQDHWLNCGTGMSGCNFALIFAKDEVRVDVSISRPNRDENKWVFDRLHEQKDQLETTFGAPLVWMRLDDKKAARISYSQAVDGYDRDNWPTMLQWLVERMQQLQGTFSGPIASLNRKLKSTGRRLQTTEHGQDQTPDILGD